MKTRSKITKHIPLVLLILATLLAIYFIDINNLPHYKQKITQITEQNLFLSGLVYCFIYSLCVTLSLPIATVLTLLAGLLFGPIWGTFIVVISATIGATFIFLIIQSSLNGKSLLEKYTQNKSLKKLQKNIKENQASYLLFIRLVPIFPFVLVNIAPATVGVKLKTFIWTTLIGIIPATFIYVYVGHTTGQITQTSDILSPQVLIGFGLLGLISIIPVITKQILKRNKKVKKHD